MLELILFIVLGLLILVLFELRARKQRNRQETESFADGEEEVRLPMNNEVVQSQQATSDECCGQHLVCERESLLQTNATPEYFDDEELDELAGINPADFTQQQHDDIRAVFDTLQEKDVPAWCRSLQLRNIALPQDIREEALLICRERRQMK
ncbi:MAG: phospholipase [Paludibacteraceae bacterium]|nr:phospholipase [Paludibacteraceae bacterium]